MQKIDKTAGNILSIKYKDWLDKLNESDEAHPANGHYYDDVVMNLYKCQSGVCAYTEMRICVPELYQTYNWAEGRYQIPENVDYSRIDHFGHLEHFNAENKKLKFWNWDNLFMIHAKINGIKTNKVVAYYLKPDLDNYSPEKYFEYDNQTNRFVPNTEIEDPKESAEIQYMIDHVLCLNHGVVRNERRDYINMLASKMQRGEAVNVDRFFTSVKWALSL